MIEIDAVNQHNQESDLQPLKTAALRILSDDGVSEGALSIAVVDDETIHELNRQYLQHDYHTDVLSFLLDREGGRLEGDIVVSWDTAARQAEEWGWNADDELLLYVVHGTLHLIGYDDHSDEDRAAMRAKEVEYFAALGRPEPPGRVQSPTGGQGDGLDA